MKMPFGKHKGKSLEDIDEDYLQWVLDTCNSYPRLKAEISRILNPKTDTPLAEDLVNVWYRRMAMEFHPDRQGNLEAMKAINRAREVLLEMVGK